MRWSLDCTYKNCMHEASAFINTRDNGPTTSQDTYGYAQSVTDTTFQEEYGLASKQAGALVIVRAAVQAPSQRRRLLSPPPLR